MNTAEFVSHLQSQDVRLSAEGESLRVDAPQGVITDTLRAQLAERKAELLKFIHTRDQLTVLPRIPRRKQHTSAPLAFSQERLWFLTQLVPPGDAYNICRAYRLTGKLNFVALESSLNTIVERHKVLRSAIRLVNDQPRQFVQPFSPVKIPMIDIQRIPKIECDRELHRRIEQSATVPFDFSAGIFFRAQVVRLSPLEHILILGTHHIVSDAWSMGILARELWSLYEGRRVDPSFTLDELPLQYADYAVWQRDADHEGSFEAQLFYWKNQLKGLSTLNLPIDRPRPLRQSYRGSRIPVALSEPLTRSIMELSHQCNATPFMTLLAAFQVLLYRYTAQQDIVIGAPIANRSDPDLQRLVGVFVNMLVLRADLSGTPTFKEFLARVRNVCLGAYSHGYVPFEKLVHRLEPQRDLRRHPLFQVMFALQNTPRFFSAVANLRIEPIEVTTNSSLFDLSLFLRQRDDKLIGYFEYRSDLFDRSTIERIGDHFTTLLEGITACPNQSISHVPLLTEAQRQRILIEWNNTVVPYPKDQHLHNLFESQARKTPDAVALSFSGTEVTYRELDASANRLAHFLQKRGVQPEKLVGLCLERSLDTVVALLGILKAGGAYVPLDPTYPVERLRLLLNDAGITVLVTRQSIIDGTRREIQHTNPGGPGLGRGVYVVCLDRDLPEIHQQSCAKPIVWAAPETLAYVIYTSGSTGQPKGVAIEHRSVVNLLYWARNVYTTQEIARVLASTSTGFDLSIFELFVPLSWGGTAVLVENVLALADPTDATEVTLVNTVPSAMSTLLDSAGLPKSANVVNLAGELLLPELVQALYLRESVAKVYDLYGPSETTTYSTFALRTPGRAMTIGQPIANTEVFVLEPSLQPSPIGGRGEIFIGGTGVARGYLHAPDLTAARFTPTPFSGARSHRLYRTGDVARYLPNGNIQYLGRYDSQVKVRGHRVELREIENVLSEHTAVKDCVVVARERGLLRNQTLIGYVVLEEPQALSPAELHTLVRTALPEYMIPSHFVIMDVLPRTTNNKIDRLHLPLPDLKRPPLEVPYVEPRSQAEELLSRIWADILNIEGLSINDNFFELGGHSLLAFQLISRTREVFDKDVPITALFEAPTIAGLAAAIEQTTEPRSCAPLPIAPLAREHMLPLTVNQEHLWRLDRLIPGTYFFNVSYVYRLRGRLALVALDEALQIIVGRHEALRTVFVESAAQPRQIIKQHGNVQLAYLDISNATADEISANAAVLIVDERHRPFDLATGPLARIHLLRLTDTHHILLVTMHHIITDHWSMQIFIRELRTLYHDFVHHRGPSLRKSPLQAADYAVWERSALENGLLNGHRSYWCSQLAEPLGPTLFPEPSNQPAKSKYHTRQERLNFDADMLARLQRFCSIEGYTPFMVLVAALSIYIHDWTMSSDIRIGTIIANRVFRQTESLFGHLANTVVLRIKFSAQALLSDLLRHVRTTTLEAFAHQQLPFEHLARVLETEQHCPRASLFDVLFIYRRRLRTPGADSGLRFDPLEANLDSRRAQLSMSMYPLTFRMLETTLALTGTVEYKTDCVDSADVLRLSSGLKALINTIPLLYAGRRRDMRVTDLVASALAK